MLVAELKQLASDVKRTGVTLLLEPCNHKETHFLNKQDHGAELIRAWALRIQIAERFLPYADRREGYRRDAHASWESDWLCSFRGRRETPEPGSLPFDYRPGFRALKKWGYAGG